MDDDLTGEPAPDTWIRDTCPLCGSDQVIHHIRGMPDVDAYDSSPPWVIWEGCCGIGPDRTCLSCENTWHVDDDDDDEDWEDGLAHDDEESAPRAPAEILRTPRPHRPDGPLRRPLRPKPLRRPRPGPDA